jgi:hypothetical protein
MRKSTISVAMAFFLAMAMMGTAFASSHAPSTNDENRDNGWAHFNVLDVRIGEVDVEFVSTRSFASCFEWTPDGERNDAPNFNPDFEGLYSYVCVNNNTLERTLTADEYVEIRLAFGAETDERFDWERVDVLADAQTKDDCKDGGWDDFGFRNQGQCIRFVNTGQDSR